MKRWLSYIVTWGLIFIAAISSSQACTDFRLKAQDGTIVIGRSMEFAVDMHSNLMSSPRERVFNNATPSGKSALSWVSQYGYVFLDAFNTGMAVDGMNEHGLAVEALYLPGETQYQTIPPGKENQALPYLRFADWILGNFRSIDDVKKALSTVYVFAQEIPQQKNLIFPLHFNITDSNGNSIVVEFIGGKMKTHDNVLGVLTNSPTYNWQITNLRNYVNLSPSTPKPIVDNGIKFTATGQGAGMMGLPGDISPPSRFVKISILLKTVFTPVNADAAINLAQHIINNVDIPLGFVRSGENVNKATNELTQWVVFKDLTNKIFYYRTYEDLTLRSVDLSRVDLSAEAKQFKMPIASRQYVMDMTDKFIGADVKTNID